MSPTEWLNVAFDYAVHEHIDTGLNVESAVALVVGPEIRCYAGCNRVVRIIDRYFEPTEWRVPAFAKNPSAAGDLLGL